MMNPIGLFTYYVTRTVGLSDVGAGFFIGSKISRRIVYGPGVIVVTDNNTLKDCMFFGCDFVVVPEGTFSQASLEMRNCECRNMRFQKVTFMGTASFAEAVRAAIREEARSEMNIIYGTPVPVPAGI